MYKSMCILVLRFSHYVYVAREISLVNKAECAHSKHDDQDEDKMNTLAFVSFAHLHDLIPTLAGVITYIYILYQAK